MSVERAHIVVYNGHDNVVQLRVDNAGTSTGLTANTTRATLTVGAVTVSSNDAGTPIAWDDDGVLTMKLGHSSLVAGSHTGCRLVLFDAVNSNGIMWAELDVEVK